ncbi:MAG: pilus assembly protein PilP [Syntrophorhabdales bacterium]|jgi:Tfp pilus assembly protein PilP
MVLLSVVSLPLALPFSVHSEEGQAAKGVQPQPVKDDFAYTSQDRRDPFEPVYLLRKAKHKFDRPDERVGYELEELKFVGVIKSGAVRFAMMEDVQGKGLLFKQGDFLNKNLWVSDILEDKVILAHKLRNDIRKISIDIPRK